MGVVFTSHSISLDGFIAQPNGHAGPLFAWLSSGDHKSRHGTLTMSRESREVFDGIVDRIGATIAGRKTYDDSGGWDGQLPFPWPFFIVTHRPPANARKLPFEFVTGGVARAVELAKSAAGDKDVSVMGGGIVCQLLEEGLLDEVRLDLVPILLGEGTRLLDRLHVGGIRLAQTRVVEAPGVTHLGFRVLR